jgi:hypothetical protein
LSEIDFAILGGFAPSREMRLAMELSSRKVAKTQRNAKQAVKAGVARVDWTCARDSFQRLYAARVGFCMLFSLEYGSYDTVTEMDISSLRDRDARSEDLVNLLVLCLERVYLK